VEYFDSRPRGSQIGAWASRQSEVLEDEHVLEDRVKAIEKKFEGRKVECPEFWGGWRIVPL
jgi:pyridoxamine 5'-phosphate oxidase